jgi:FKBP-type peptidyl-prolyl cis-trans isomerase (trigger factor)
MKIDIDGFIRDATPEEFAAIQKEIQNESEDITQAKNIRNERNNKLKECDWTQVADALVDKELWATYRQALRDVTSQEGFPWTIDWPTIP